MYLLLLKYYKSSECEYSDESFRFDYLKGDPLDFAELYNLKEVVFAGEIDYERETNIEEVKKWLEDGIIRLAYPEKDAKKFNEIVMSNPSPILVISAFYWQSGYD